MSAELPMYMHELDGYEIEYSSNEFKHIRSKDSLEFELASKSYICRCDHDRAFIGWSFTPAFRREIFELRFERLRQGNRTLPIAVLDSPSLLI